MFKFRPHRGSLSDAMQDVREFETRDELLEFLNEDLEGMAVLTTMEIKPYTYDGRIRWDSHIVTAPGHGVLGFTDCLPPEKPLAHSI